jgi:hypothetical protein
LRDECIEELAARSGQVSAPRTPLAPKRYLILVALVVLSLRFALLFKSVTVGVFAYAAMSINKIEHRASDLPADLPPLDRIVQHCADAGYRQNGTYFAVEGIPRFWIKYGTNITLGEALTQDQVAQIVNADPTSVVRVPQVYLVFLRERCRYIVMQYIAGDTVARRQPSPSRYAKGDVASVAAAVKQLIDLRVPAGTPPGHVGGGPIGHDFFVECKSTSEYPTVGDLQAQVNKVRFQVAFNTYLTLTPYRPGGKQVGCGSRA